jgi:hypothetical protein
VTLSILFGAGSAIGDRHPEISTMQFFRHRQKPVVTTTTRDAVAPVAGPPDARDAFTAGQRVGRRDERARHHGHPVMALLVLLVAVVGAAVLALAAHEGSFSRAGAVADQNLSVAADQAKAASADAVAKTGQAIQNAGTKIEQKASDVAPANR